MERIKNEINKLLQKKSGHRITLGVVAIVALLILTQSLSPIEFVMEEIESVEMERADVGTWYETGGAYHYWDAPNGTFGIQSMQILNYSYLQDWFDANIKIYLNASVTGNPGTWQNASEGLEVGINWSSNLSTNRSAKLTFTINTSTAPMSLYYRIIFAVNKEILNFVNGSINGTQVQFDIPLDDNETYHMFLNWSDLIPFIQNNQVFVKRDTKTVGNDTYLWWKCQTVNQLPVNFTIVLDPTFGEEVALTGGTAEDLRDLQQLQVTAPENGEIKYLYVYIVGIGPIEALKMAVYQGGTLLNESASQMGGANGWRNFTCNVSITGGTLYNLSVLGNATTYTYRDVGTLVWFENNSASWPTFSNPNSGTRTANTNVSMYAFYVPSAPSNTAPTQSAQKIWNSTTSTEWNLNATGVSLTPTSFNVTINDADGDKMNITIMRNNGGVWETVNQTSGSGLSNGTYNFTNTSWINTQATQYNITFNVTDGEDWINESYNFTTLWTNSVPVLSTPYPTNQSSGISRWTQLNITVTDADANHTLNVYIYTNNTGGGQWYLMQSNISVANGTVVRDMNYSNASAYSTKYWWKVACNDSFANTTAIYEFTTESAPPWSNTAPTLTLESPVNGSTAQSRFPTLSVVVTDADGNNSAVDWYYLDGAVWYHLQHNASIASGVTTRIMNFTNASAYSTTYYWKVHANDTHDNISEIYHFTTEGDYIELTPGTTFIVGNENYTNNVTLHLSQILINDTWIMFNGTGFYVDSSSSILFRIMYIDSNIAGAGNGDTVLEFWTENGTGNVWYNLSGFPVDTNYQIKRNGSIYTTDQSNATGNITFNCSLGVLSHWEIIVSLTGPTITSENPTDGSTGISLQPVCNVTVNDAQGDTINVTFASDYSGPWQNYQTNVSVGNGSYSWHFTGANSNSTTYNWRVYADDGTTNNSDTYSFTTISTNTAPVATNDAYNVDEADILSIDNISGVLANDNDTDGDNLTAILVNDVNQGNLTLNSDGSFIYKAPVDFSGIVTFTYYANDSTENSNLATVYIYVTQASGTPWDNTMLCYQRIWTKDDKGQIVIVYSGGRIKRITGYDSIIVIGMDDVKKFEGLLFLYG